MPVVTSMSVAIVSKSIRGARKIRWNTAPSQSARLRFDRTAWPAHVAEASAGRPGAAFVVSAVPRAGGEVCQNRCVTDADTPTTDESQQTWLSRFVRCHLPMLIVGLVIVVAVVFVAQDRWRRGALFFGGATLLAAVFRLCLPEVRVGLLAVRSKRFDVAALTLLGSAIVFIGVTINTLGVS